MLTDKGASSAWALNEAPTRAKPVVVIRSVYFFEHFTVSFVNEYDFGVVLGGGCQGSVHRSVASSNCRSGQADDWCVSASVVEEWVELGRSGQYPFTVIKTLTRPTGLL